MRTVQALAGALALALVATGASGAGTINVAGATLTIGTGTPAGTITNQPDLPPAVAPSIPPLGTLGSIGSFSSQMPAFPGGGTGADNAFTASGALIGPGGTFNYTTYTVDAGATVTYSSSVVIKTTGDVNINGTVATNAPNVSITFLCGGNFAMSGTGKVDTAGATSSILIDANGAFGAADGGALVSANGDCEVRAHGGDVVTPGATIRALDGDLTLRASGGLSCTDNLPKGAFTASSDVLIQAFGGDAAINVIGNFPSRPVYGADSIRIEASQNVTLTGSIDLNSALGPASVTAFGGDLTLRLRSDVTGAFTGRASANVFVNQGSLKAGGAMTLTAFSGDVDVKPFGGGYIMQTGGQLTLEASHDVLLVGAGQFAASGSVLYRALGGKVLIDQGSSLNGTGGLVDIRALDRVVLGTGGNVGLSFRITAGAGGFTGGLGGFTAQDGPIDLTTLGPIAIGGQFFTHTGNITVTSCNAGVTLPGGRLRTAGDNGPTPSVIVQSFADTAGVIDLAGGEIETGDSSGAKSGDIRLRVYQGKLAGGGGGGETVDGYLLVTKWTTVVNPKKPDKSKVLIAGILDLGTATPDLHASSDFDIGDINIDLDAPVTKGKKLVAKGDGGVLTLTPNAKGGSRVPFSLAWTGDLTGAFALDGEISPRLRIGGLDTKGTIVLAGGKFNRAKAAGRLIIPCIFPEKVLAGLKGGGKDTLNATIGFATPGTGPASLDPGFTFAFGPSFTADVAASSFGPKKKEKFTYKNKAGGLTDVVVDYAKGVVTVKGKGLDLGTFTDGANEVTIRIVVAGVERIVVVRLTKSGPKLVY